MPEQPENPSQQPKIWCRRVERDLPLDEHRRCPYCLGAKEDILSEEHDAFCDFRPGVDPIHFGFPEDRGRDLNS